MENTENRIQYLENKVHILNRLAEISAVLNSTLELDALLSYLMDAAAAIADAEAASVLLWDANKSSMTDSHHAPRIHAQGVGVCPRAILVRVDRCVADGLLLGYGVYGGAVSASAAHTTTRTQAHRLCVV